MSRIILDLKLSADELRRANVNEHDLTIILRDALAEYVVNRANGNGAEYVEHRYPGEAVYAGQRREEKIDRVNRYCRAATAIHNFYDITVEG